MPYPLRASAGGGAGFTVGPPSNIFGVTAGNVSTTPLVVQPATTRASAEVVRDNYFTTNPVNLVIYDEEGNEALGVVIYFTDGTSIETVGQTRVGGVWRDSLSFQSIQGLPGSGTDFSSVSENHIPAVGAGPDKTPFDSGLVVMPDNVIATEGILRIGTNTLQFGLAQSISAAGRNVAFSDDQSGIYMHPIWQTFELGRTSYVRNRYSENDVVIGANEVDLINPTWFLIVPRVAEEDGQTAVYTDVIVSAGSALTNVKVEVQIGGVIFETFDNITITEGNYRFNYSPRFDYNVGDELTFSVSSPDGDVILRGQNGSNIPLATNRVLLYKNENVALNKDVIAQQAQIDELVNSRFFETINEYRVLQQDYVDLGLFIFDSNIKSADQVIVKYEKIGSVSSRATFRVVYSGNDPSHLSDIYFQASLVANSQGEFYFVLIRTATVFPSASPIILELQGKLDDAGASGSIIHISTILGGGFNA